MTARTARLFRENANGQFEPVPAQTYACCVHCEDDQPHIDLDTHDLPCTLCSRAREVDSITALAALDTSDPERAHSEADKILLAAVSPDVRAAYAGVMERCDWWASA